MELYKTRNLSWIGFFYIKDACVVIYAIKNAVFMLCGVSKLFKVVIFLTAKPWNCTRQETCLGFFFLYITKTAPVPLYIYAIKNAVFMLCARLSDVETARSTLKVKASSVIVSWLLSLVTISDHLCIIIWASSIAIEHQ